MTECTRKPFSIVPIEFISFALLYFLSRIVSMRTKLNKSSMKAQQKPAYKVAICWDDCYGEEGLDVLKGMKKPIYITLSPDTVYINKTRIEAILSWAVKHSNKILVVEGTFLNRWNEANRLNGDINLAHQESVCATAKMTSKISKIIIANNWSEKITVFGFQDFIESQIYQQALLKVKKYYQHSPHLRLAVERAARDFSKRRPDHNQQQITGFSIEYLLEEITLFPLISSVLGYPTEVYHGKEHPILRAIVGGEFEDFPIDTKNRSMISIDVEKQIIRDMP